MEQLSTFNRRAQAVAASLGQWAGEIYIHECIQKFLAEDSDAQLILKSMQDDEKHHLKGLLRRVSPGHLAYGDGQPLSSKLSALITFLGEEETSNMKGLMFVQTRAEVAVISRILSLHPKTRHYATATFVGTSSFADRRHKLCNLADAQDQKVSLTDLREGRVKLVISTSVLEEGIDVTSSNLVICFELPKSLKAFIQRRGRIRHEGRYVLLLDPDADEDNSTKWQDLETLLAQVYDDDARELDEGNEDHVEEHDERLLQVDSTGYAA